MSRNRRDQAKATQIAHRLLETWFRQSLKQIDIKRTLIQQMSVDGGHLHIGKRSYLLAQKKQIVLIAAGKAAVPMCASVAEILHPALQPHQHLSGMVVGVEPTDALPREIQVYQGSHPLPNQVSRDAAHAAIRMLRLLGKDDLVIFLISGGASSMLEAPLDSNIPTEEVQDFYQNLVHSGLNIIQMNALRKHLSAVKGGRLAAFAAPATQCTLVVSDVPVAALDAIGSGPSVPDSSTVNDCLEIIKANHLDKMMGPEIRNHFLSPNLPETPKVGDPVFADSEVLCLVSSEDLLEQARRMACSAGYDALIDNCCDEWGYREASDYLVDRLFALRKNHRKVCLLSGGEISVKVPHGGGVGGRNQHFVLYTALRLSGSRSYAAVMSAGSDGIDGNSPAAGAIADSFTITRAYGLCIDPRAALGRFESYSFFQALGGTIMTGPTGNNVRDIRILLTR